MLCQKIFVYFLFRNIILYHEDTKIQTIFQANAFLSKNYRYETRYFTGSSPLKNKNNNNKNILLYTKLEVSWIGHWPERVLFLFQLFLLSSLVGKSRHVGARPHFWLETFKFHGVSRNSGITATERQRGLTFHPAIVRGISIIRRRRVVDRDRRTNSRNEVNSVSNQCPTKH